MYWTDRNGRWHRYDDLQPGRINQSAPRDRIRSNGHLLGASNRPSCGGPRFPMESDLPWESWEPAAGANAFRLVPTHCDDFGRSPQVRSSPFDSLRPGQTPDSCLGVKGSPVQIRPSRPEGPGQKGFRVLARAPFRSSGAKQGHL